MLITKINRLLGLLWSQTDQFLLRPHLFLYPLGVLGDLNIIYEENSVLRFWIRCNAHFHTIIDSSVDGQRLPAMVEYQLIIKPQLYLTVRVFAQ